MSQRCAARVACAVAALWFAWTPPAAADVEAEAYAGRPFGVGRITVRDSVGETADGDVAALALVEQDGRALYPAFTSGRLLKLLGQLLELRLLSPTRLELPPCSCLQATSR